MVTERRWVQHTRMVNQRPGEEARTARLRRRGRSSPAGRRPSRGAAQRTERASPHREGTSHRSSGTSSSLSLRSPSTRASLRKHCHACRVRERSCSRAGKSVGGPDMGGPLPPRCTAPMCSKQPVVRSSVTNTVLLRHSQASSMCFSRKTNLSSS
jgi:hypothetical protein